MGTFVVILLIALGLQAIIANYLSEAAKEKGHDEGAFWLCFLFGPAGWAFVIALPDLKQRTNQERIIELLEKATKLPTSESKTQVEKVTFDNELPPL